MPVSRKRNIVSLNAALKVKPSRTHKCQLPSLAINDPLEFKLRKDVSKCAQLPTISPAYLAFFADAIIRVFLEVSNTFPKGLDVLVLLLNVLDDHDMSAMFKNGQSVKDEKLSLATDLCTLGKSFNVLIDQFGNLSCELNARSFTVATVLRSKFRKKLLHFIYCLLVFCAHFRLLVVEHSAQFVPFGARLPRQHLTGLELSLEMVYFLCALIPFGPPLGQFGRILLLDFVNHVDVFLFH